MADPTMSQLAFDPGAMGGARTSFQPQGAPPAPQGPSGPVSVTLDPSGSGDANWQRILQAAKAGLVSPQALQKYAQQKGYAMPQMQAPQGQQPQQQQTNDPAMNLGQVAGDLIGRTGQMIQKQMTAPQQPPGQAEGPGAQPQDQPNKMLEQQIAKPGINIPPWNQ